MKTRPLLLLACALASSPRLVLANGRFPQADHLVIDPGNPAHYAVRTTYGIVQSFDAGRLHQWLCEDVFGNVGQQDPPIALTLGGAMVVAVPLEGISVATDRGCNVTKAGEPVSGQWVVDITVEPRAPTHVLAVTSTNVNGVSKAFLAESADDGATFRTFGSLLPDDLLATTIEVSASRPERLYVGAVPVGSLSGYLLMSDDRGQTWARHPLTGVPEGMVPYVSAVDPQRPDRVYVRVTPRQSESKEQDRVLVSDDAGQTFRVIFTAEDKLLGFALSPDGSKVAVGNPKQGIFVGDTTGFAFEKTSPTGARCLTWGSSGIYACASEIADGFTVGLSTDEGKTFQALYHRSDVCPLSCSTESAVAQTCGPLWPMTQMSIGQPAAGCTNGQGSMYQPIYRSDAGVDGGDAADAQSAGAPLRAEGGCTCGLPSRNQEGGGRAGWLGLSIAVLAAARRRTRATS